jgi:hypothetical protein
VVAAHASDAIKLDQSRSRPRPIYGHPGLRPEPCRRRCRLQSCGCCRGSEASSALRAAARALQEASDALDAAKAAFKIQDDLALEWQEENPAPDSDRRKLKRWFRRERDRRQASAMRTAWDAQIVAEGAFESAQIGVAKVEPRDVTDLVLKACLAFVVEEPANMIGRNAHIIARSVALNLATMASRVAS